MSQKKSIFTCFDCLTEEFNIWKTVGKYEVLFLHTDCGFRKFISNNAIAMRRLKKTQALNIIDELYIDFSGLCSKIFANYITFKEVDFKKRIVIIDDTLILFINVNSKVSTEALSNNITALICDLDIENLHRIKNIRVSLFDFALFFIFADLSVKKDISGYQYSSEFWSNCYQDWIRKLKYFELRFKSGFFSMFSQKLKNRKIEDSCLDKHNLLSDIGISFNVVYLKDYKECIICKD
jgi:hypothetical protein